MQVPREAAGAVPGLSAALAGAALGCAGDVPCACGQAAISSKTCARTDQNQHGNPKSNNKNRYKHTD